MESKAEMMLFSLELARYPYPYRLYFAELQTVSLAKPKIHCLCVKNAKAFYACQLGGIYTLVYRKLQIREMNETGHYALSEAEYFHLLAVRDKKYAQVGKARHIDCLAAGYDPADYYYSYATAQKLLEFRPGFARRALVFFGKLVAYFLAYIVPIALYVLFIYALLHLLKEPNGVLSHPVGAAIAALGAFPFVLAGMTELHFLAEHVLLNIEQTRYPILRLYFLRWAGMRKSCEFDGAERRRIGKNLLVTFLIFVVSLAVVFFVF